jgi:hypothetical protein
MVSWRLLTDTVSCTVSRMASWRSVSAGVAGGAGSSRTASSARAGRLKKNRSIGNPQAARSDYSNPRIGILRDLNGLSIGLSLGRSTDTGRACAMQWAAG